jgi:hypothetical protein
MIGVELEYFLSLSCFLLPCLFLISIIECIFSGLIIPRAGWNIIIILYFAYNLVWWSIFMLRGNTARKYLQKLYKTYKLYLYSNVLQSLLLCIIIIPVGYFSNTINDERYKDYLLLFPLLSGTSIISGMHLINLSIFYSDGM